MVKNIHSHSSQNHYSCDRFTLDKYNDGEDSFTREKSLILQNPILFLLISFERPEIRSFGGA